MIIQDLKAVLNEDNEFIIVTANINNIIHYTADIRKIRSEYYAVFSDITVFDPLMNESSKYLIDKGIWKSYDIEKIKVQVDHYIWVKINITNIPNLK